LVGFEAKLHNLRLPRPALRQNQLDGLVTFVCVARMRGFSAAAIELGVSPSAVSQAIRQLEARVGTPIELDIAIDSALVDIVRLGFDAGIRYGDMVERDMVGVRVGPTVASRVVASPAYLARRGTPKHPRDLAAHDCIRFRSASTGRTARWLFEKARKRIDLAVAGPLVLNDDAAMLEAAMAGAGLAYLASGYVDRAIADGRLVAVLADWCPDMPSLTMYYPSRRRVPRRLAALLDFLREQRAETADARKARRRPGRRAARA
jgi:DNA-binding transcriptional LysR family regulator